MNDSQLDHIPKFTAEAALHLIIGSLKSTKYDHGHSVDIIPHIDVGGCHQFAERCYKRCIEKGGSRGDCSSESNDCYYYCRYGFLP